MNGNRTGWGRGDGVGRMGPDGMITSGGEGRGRMLSAAQPTSRVAVLSEGQSNSQSQSQSQSQPEPVSETAENERWCSQMALILGVPTVELELQGTMQVPFRGKTGGELQVHLTDWSTAQATFWPPAPCLCPGCDTGKVTEALDAQSRGEKKEKKFQFGNGAIG